MCAAPCAANLRAVITRVRAISDSCGNDLHERCDRMVDVIPGVNSHCTCHCHGSWAEFVPAALVAGVLGLAFGTVGWVLRGWLR